MRVVSSLVLSCTLWAGGCAFESPPASPPTVSYGTFRDMVYPVLMRDCGFPACHGDTGRFFRVYGPGRTRLDGVGFSDPMNEDEVRASFERARSMLASAERVEDTLLLRKPLEIDRGGAPHMGIDRNGRDVYADPDAEGYRQIHDWAAVGFEGAAP